MNTPSGKKDVSTYLRREFIGKIAATVGLTALQALDSKIVFASPIQSKLTIQQVIDIILKEIPGAPFPKTVDTIKSGDGQQAVTGF